MHGAAGGGHAGGNGPARVIAAYSQPVLLLPSGPCSPFLFPPCTIAASYSPAVASYSPPTPSLPQSPLVRHSKRYCLPVPCFACALCPVPYALRPCVPCPPVPHAGKMAATIFSEAVVAIRTGRPPDKARPGGVDPRAQGRHHGAIPYPVLHVCPMSCVLSCAPMCSRVPRLWPQAQCPLPHGR